MAFTLCPRVPILLAGLLLACGGDGAEPAGADGGAGPAPSSALVGQWVHESEVSRLGLDFEDGGVFVARQDGDETGRGSFRTEGYLLELDQPSGDGTDARERLRFYVVPGEALGLHALFASGELGDGLVGTWLGESSTSTVDDGGVVDGSGERVRLSLRVDGTFKSYQSAYRLERQDGEVVEIPGDERVLQGTWTADDAALRLALDGGGSAELAVLGDRAALGRLVYRPAK